MTRCISVLEEEVQLHGSLTLALDKGDVSRPGRFYPTERDRPHWIGGWVGPRHDSNKKNLPGPMGHLESEIRLIRRPP
jgi:hypothetical protein